jgi:hypothetical protein
MIAGLPFEPIESIYESIDWTMTTDLIHGSTWQYLQLTPPDINLIPINNLPPDSKNRIDSDFDKFGVKWLDRNNWVNSVGVTNTMALEAVYRYKSPNPWAGRFNQYIYADVRSGGLTHEQIVNIHNGSVTEEIMDQQKVVIKHRINQRLNKILATSL